MSCVTCAPIGAGLSANTGRDERLPKEAHVLESLGWGSDHDLQRCPGCGDLFWYDSEQAQTGSGNNDEDTVHRLSTRDAELVGALLRGEPREQVFALQWSVRDLVLQHVSRDVVRAFIPRIVAEIAAGRDSYTLNSSLYDLAGNADDARTILSTIDGATHERFKSLRDKCQATLSAMTTQS